MTPALVHERPCKTALTLLRAVARQVDQAFRILDQASEQWTAAQHWAAYEKAVTEVCPVSTRQRVVKMVGQYVLPQYSIKARQPVGFPAGNGTIEQVAGASLCWPPAVPTRHLSSTPFGTVDAWSTVRGPGVRTLGRVREGRHRGVLLYKPLLDVSVGDGAPVITRVVYPVINCVVSSVMTCVVLCALLQT